MTKTVKALCVCLGIISVLMEFFPRADSTVLANQQNLKGVWVTTLYSMDYPTTPTKDEKTLKKNIDTLVNQADDLGYNALFFQVRPSGDAFYKSEIYPWSKHLTGSWGEAPQNGFDPLEYIVQQAHKKDITLHAWINPYRLTASEGDNAAFMETDFYKKNAHLIRTHTDGKLYLDPGEPEAIELVTKGALEIVKNYAVDGIHIDDYFYPSTAFPDGETFTKYGGSHTDIGDWRRENTYTLVSTLHKEIKKQKATVVFSVSPSGIWANKSSHNLGSETNGKQAYFDYYADTRLWAKDGIMDVIIPQIYWEVGHSLADFETLCKWWADVTADTGVSLCIGQAVYKAQEATDTASPWYREAGLKEIEKQIDIINKTPGISGFAHFRMGSILKSDLLYKGIKAKLNTPTALFTDTHQFPWAKDAIEDLYSAGIVKGMGDGTFGGMRQVSRADFMVMLMRLTEQDVPFTENFTDVAPDKYYYNALGTAKVLGFAQGREDGTFAPTESISRQDMATLAYRVMVKMGKIKEDDAALKEGTFTDQADISSYALPAVSKMVEDGFLTGLEDGRFDPKSGATRAQCAMFLSRLKKLL